MELRKVKQVSGKPQKRNQVKPEFYDNFLVFNGYHVLYQIKALFMLYIILKGYWKT